jgi:8-oxo-dGTP pyrophosphatase MutT (NUDIX family)
MELIKEIFHKPGIRKNGKTIRREAVRGIIADGNKLLMIYSTKNGDFKFPGGGVAAGETYEQALVREVREECGAIVTRISGEFGKIIEYDLPIEKNFDAFCMTSLYYFCQIEAAISEQCLDPYEKDLGFQPVWVEIDEAIRTNLALLQSGSPKIPRWTRRDTYLLEVLKQRLA